MAATKLEGFKWVAVVRFPDVNSREYYYALYDVDDIKPGDKVLVTGGAYPLPQVSRIITAEEARNEFNNNIISEVICKVDTSKYDARVIARYEKEKLKSEMNKRKKEIEKMKDEEYYASMDDQFAAMLKKYREYEV